MPVVMLQRERSRQVAAYETPAQLEADAELKARVERIRLAIGPRMNLGDVTRKTVPKMCLVAPPRAGGAICTRTFIPHRVHEAIGVLGAVSVATACVLPGSVAAQVGAVAAAGSIRALDVEHPTGFFTVDDRSRDRRIVDRGAPLGAAAHRAQADARRGVRARRALEQPMSDLRRICLLGFGEVGQVLAADLRARG